MASLDIREAFLARHGWQVARRDPFPADWSARSYVRLYRPNAQPDRAILMIAPPGPDFTMFARVDQVLRQLGASAPEIYGIDPEHGLMLLEDFGDANFGRLIDGGAEARPYLLRAAETLTMIRTRFNPHEAAGLGLPLFNTNRFLALLDPVLDLYIPAKTGNTVNDSARHDFTHLWRQALDRALDVPQTLMLRDFMADNVMDLPQRDGWRSVGLLDFELAGIGPVTYDIASLTEQVRRDLNSETIDIVLAEWLKNFPRDQHNLLRRSITILATQRHLRIIAVLYKLTQNDPTRAAKRAYLSRLWRWLDRLLDSSDLAEIRSWLMHHLPPALREAA